MKNQFILFISILIFCACEQKHFYNEYQSVDIKKWASTDTLHFTVDVNDVQPLYSIFLSVRNQKDYEFSNLWLNIITSSNGEKKSVRTEVPLFKNDGKPYGKTSGSLSTQTVPFQQLHFPQKGKYIIDIIQLMRKDPLDGISDIGVIIDKK